MEGNPADFETIGSRIGLYVVEDSGERLRLLWQGPRFPAFLCLGVALLLLFISIPIGQAIYLHGFASRIASLWYFPLMNLVLIAIAFYLFAQQRRIIIESSDRVMILMKRNLTRTLLLKLSAGEIEHLKLSVDQVYSGFALAGSSAAQRFPIPSLRLSLTGGATVLLDRGGAKRLEELGKKIARRLGLSLERDPALR
jgi:hypothetical protein